MDFIASNVDKLTLYNLIGLVDWDTVLMFSPSKPISGRKPVQVGCFGSQQLPGSQAQPADAGLRQCSLAAICHPLTEWLSHQHLAGSCW